MQAGKSPCSFDLQTIEDDGRLEWSSVGSVGVYFFQASVVSVVRDADGGLFFFFILFIFFATRILFKCRFIMGDSEKTAPVESLWEKRSSL